MKNRTGLNLGLFVILVALLWLSYALQPRQDLRAYEFLPQMIYPVAAESFSPAEVLPGGMVEQRPVAGSIARGQMPLHLEAGPEGAVRAAMVLSNPLLGDGEAGPDEGDLERGTELFRTYCLLGHGPGGEGNGPVAQRGFPAPPSLLAPHALRMSDGQIFHIASFGQGNMPSHGAQIDPLDRWRIILRIRELQASTSASEAAADTAATLDAAVSSSPASPDNSAVSPGSAPSLDSTPSPGEGEGR